MLKHSNIPQKEERQIVMALLVKDGSDTGFSGRVSGELIEKLETVLDEIVDYMTKEKG